MRTSSSRTWRIVVSWSVGMRTVPYPRISYHPAVSSSVVQSVQFGALFHGGPFRSPTSWVGEWGGSKAAAAPQSGLATEHLSELLMCAVRYFGLSLVYVIQCLTNCSREIQLLPCCQAVRTSVLLGCDWTKSSVIVSEVFRCCLQPKAKANVTVSQVETLLKQPADDDALCRFCYLACGAGKVPEVLRVGQSWAEARHVLAGELGRSVDFRRRCEPAAVQGFAGGGDGPGAVQASQPHPAAGPSLVTGGASASVEHGAMRPQVGGWQLAIPYRSQAAAVSQSVTANCPVASMGSVRAVMQMLPECRQSARSSKGQRAAFCSQSAGSSTSRSTVWALPSRHRAVRPTCLTRALPCGGGGGSHTTRACRCGLAAVEPTGGFVPERGKLGRALGGQEGGSCWSGHLLCPHACGADAV